MTNWDDSKTADPIGDIERFLNENSKIEEAGIKKYIDDLIKYYSVHMGIPEKLLKA